MTDLQKTIQETIDFIWRQISQIDSIGRAKVVEQCGGEGLDDLFGGARNLAKVLKAITNSLDSVTGSLACSRINPIYVEAAHNTVCNDAASAVAFGFVFFLLLGISTMTMISLRASWLRNIEEEKVYHDESEIAENMILDEHEEYLNYISRYKHEWQEYRGFEETSVIQSHEDSFEDEDSLYFDDGRGYYGSEEFSDEENSDVSNPTGFDVDIFPPSLHTPSIDDGARACAIDEISFQSLSGHKSEESASIGENEFFGMPKPLLPPPENPNYRADAPDEILIPSQEVVLKDSKSRTKRRHSSKKATSKTNDEGLTKFFDKYGIDPFAHEKEIEEHMKSDPMEEGKLDGKYDASMEVVVRTRAMSSGGVERCVRRPSSGEIARPRSSGDELLRRRQSGAGAGDLAPRSRTYTPGQSAMDSEEQFVGCEI